MSRIMMFRCCDRHRERAMQIGANRGDRSGIKLYQEDQLMTDVRGVVQEAADA